MPFRLIWNFVISRKRRRERCSYPLQLEVLEPRQPLAGDLQILSVELIDFQEQPMTAPVVGEQVFLRAQWREEGTPAGSYVVRFSVDGAVQDSVQFTPSPAGFLSGGKGLGTINMAGRMAGITFAVRGGWFVGPGEHTIIVSIDPANSVAESSETNNSIQFSFTSGLPATLPAPLLWPVGGQQNRDWACCNYVDVDNKSGTALDYRDSAFGLDGHAGYDIGAVNFAGMDLGIPVFASAAGRVVAAEDGHFDRVGSGQSSSDTRANQLEIDHGNGWSTLYGHMAEGLTVTVGDWVTPGQLLGYIGSSGGTVVPHLHWELRHFGGLVEPGFAAHSYFADSRPYRLDTPTGILDAGLTNDGHGGNERLSEIETIPRNASGILSAWTTFSHFRAGDVLTTKWIRPDGSFRSNSDTTFDSNGAGSTLIGVFPISFFDASGRWHWVQEINGVEQFRVLLEVVDGIGNPEIRVTQGSLEILDERTTPLDFGSVSRGADPPEKTFTIVNHGFAALNVSNPVLPPGFTLGSTFPTSIAAGQSASFTVQMETTVAGAKFGEVQFTTNDFSEAFFNYNIAGVVAGASPAGAPQLTLPGPAVGYAIGQGPVLIDPQSALTAADPTGFSAGNLFVEFAGGGMESDQLRIRTSADGPGQISMRDDEVYLGGTHVGTVSGGSGTVPLSVMLNAAATRSAVETLMRNIEYSNSASSPPLRPRYIRFTVTDSAGRESNQPIKKVLLADFERNVAPRVADPIEDQAADEDLNFSFTLPATTFLDDNSYDSTLIFSARQQGGEMLPEWLAFDAAARRLTGTPGNDDVGAVAVRVTATDQAGLSAEADFLIHVTNTNDAPTVANPISDRSTNEDSPFDFTFDENTFSDIDASDQLTYSSDLDTGQPLPAWLVFDPTTRRFLGTPTNNDVGTLAIRVTATDQTGDTAVEEWLLTVVNQNDPPALINSIPDQEARQDSHFQFTLDANTFADEDLEEVLHYSAMTPTGLPLPIWLSFDPLNRTFSGTPRNEDVGTFQVIVTVRDSSQASASGEFAIEVQNINDPPTELSLDNLRVLENLAGAIVGNVTISDPDPGDSHQIMVSDSRFEVTSGQLRLKSEVSLDYEIEETIDLLIRAIDKGEPPSEIERLFKIEVADVNEFAPEVPEMFLDLPENSEADTTVGVVAATDGDTSQSLALAISAGNEDGTFALDSTSGLLTVARPEMLDHESTPQRILMITAVDSGTPPQSATNAVVVTIANVNEAPNAVKTIGAIRVLAETSFRQILPEGIFVDPDAGDQLRLFLSQADGSELPSWLTFETESQSLMGAAPNLEAGRLSLILTAQDSGTPSLQASVTFNLDVEANESPWQNVLLPEDVNRDETVSPIDALLGINALNSNRFGQAGSRLPLPFNPLEASYDVNGDGILTPIDVRIVINRLNSSALPESEWVYSKYCICCEAEDRQLAGSFTIVVNDLFSQAVGLLRRDNAGVIIL